jgi:hypothetical protein
MRRFGIHMLIWVFAVPWLASAIWWLFYMGPDLIRLPLVFLLSGLLGAAYCGFVTIPTSTIVYFVFLTRPEWVKKKSFQCAFVIVSILIGACWARITQGALKPGSAQDVLIVIGGVAGLFLSVITLYCWTHKSKGVAH